MRWVPLGRPGKRRSRSGVCDAGAFFGSIVQRLQVRFYSISSSPLMHPKSIHITCAVVYEKTVTGSPPLAIL